MHIGLDPREEVGYFGEDSWLILASTGSPGHYADNVELSGLSFGRTNEGAAGITHAGGATVRTKSNHARVDHIRPTGFQIGISPDFALELLELIGHSSRWSHKTPAGEPAPFSSMVVLSGVRHASCAGIRSAKIDVGGQFDQSDIVLNRMRLVKLGVDNDLGNLDVLFGSVVVLLMPFSDANAEFRGSFALHEAVSGAKDPARGNQSTSANVLFLKESIGRKSEGDLPGKLSVSSGESVDNTAGGTLLAAGLEGGGTCHDGDQYDQDLHLYTIDDLPWPTLTSR